MEETTFVADRSSWSEGPWDAEPEDRVDFLHAGFSCFIKRGPMGAWCGYVGVPATHPAYGQYYDEVKVEVHGGLTYADQCRGSICHVPQEGMPEDVWWLGFDTAHAGDLVPGYPRDWPSDASDTYKSRAYAEAETRRLAEQLEFVGELRAKKL